MPRVLFATLIAFTVLVAACSGAASRLVDRTVDDTTSTTVAPGEAPDDDTHYRWEVGDCILIEQAEDLPYEPYGRSALVDCSQPHAYEVYFTGDFEDGEGADFPEDIGERVWEVCAAAFKDYIGVHLSESGLDIVLYQPDRSEWSRGLRYQACVVQDPTAGGEVPLSTGSLRGVGGAIPFAAEVGDCFEDRAARGPTTDCADPHRAEIIGFLTHEAGDGSYPGAAALRAEADTGCVALLGGYATSGAAAIEASPVAFARLLSEAEWDDGLRTVPCTALVFDADRRHLMVVGSLSDPDWWVIAAEQAA